MTACTAEAPAVIPRACRLGADPHKSSSREALYEHAVADMVDRTSTELAPWTLVEAEDKHFARIKVLKTLVKALERAMA